MASVLLTLAVAAFFALMGLLALVKPGRIVAPFGMRQLTADGRSEVRAVYGGFGIAISLLLLASLWCEPIRPGVLAGVGAALLGMAAGRLISALADRSLGRYPGIFLAIESGLAAMLFAAL